MATFETYTVRAMWEGGNLSELTGGDHEAASTAYDALESFYLNLPVASQAEGVTLQMSRESDGHVTRETTF